MTQKPHVCFNCYGALTDLTTIVGRRRLKCTECGCEWVTDSMPEQEARPPHLPPGKMKTAHDIDSMIDYFTARGGGESDISILKWVLGLHKSEWEVKYDEAVAAMNVAANEGIRIIEKQRETIAIQDAEIRRLKSEPDHK